MEKAFALPRVEKRLKPRLITDVERKGNAYLKTKIERVNKKWAGRRAIKAKEKEEENKLKA